MILRVKSIFFMDKPDELDEVNTVFYPSDWRNTLISRIDNQLKELKNRFARFRKIATLILQDLR